MIESERRKENGSMEKTIWKQESNTKKCIKCGYEFVIPSALLGNNEACGWRGKLCWKCRRFCSKDLRHGDPYKGWKASAPGLYKGNFKGGIDVNDISGDKYRCYLHFGFGY